MKPRNTKVIIRVLTALAMIVCFSTAGFSQERPHIQIAILLDTSNSMDGLIDQAKSHLWKIVNEMSQMKKDGKSPRLEVALFEYGKSSLPAQEGYLRMVVPLSTDLDKISEELFNLTTNGGDEYCGQVIREATKRLQWSTSPRNLKLIFIAGNEPFTQGSVDYKKSVTAAINKGIIINTIYCGHHNEGINTGWKDGADLADGKYINIDQNHKIVYIKAPQDDEIARLGRELNKTYIAYGTAGAAMKERQKKQDMNAEKMSEESVIQRSIAKSSRHYDNASWDLADAVSGKRVSVAALKEQDLPPELRKMNKAEREVYVNNKIKERAGIQKKIQTLQEQRRAYIEKERKKQAASDTLDTAVIKAIRDQAVKKDFYFE